MSNEWAPAETPATLWFERSALAGLFIGAVGFGVHATLFFWCFSLLWPQARRGQHRDMIFLGYISLVFILSNIGNATNIKFGQMVFIDDRDYPGGPSAFFVEQSTSLAAVLCNCIYIVLSWFQDGLLLYRFWVIYGKVWQTVVFPTLMFMASVVLSCFLIVMLSRPSMTLWSTISFQLAISYWSISISFNIIVTLLIAGRLLLVRYRTRVAFHSQDSPYLTVSAMLIESAFIYSSVGLIFLISFAVNSPVQNLALPLLGQVQSIAPLLIILRVTQGKGWSKETATALVSDLRFRPAGLNTQSVPEIKASATMLATFSSQKSSTMDHRPKDIEVESAVSEFRVASGPQV